MRPAAEVDEVVVPIEADLAVLDGLVELLDLIDLVVLVQPAEERERLGHVHLAALERDILRHDRPHALLDPPEVLRLQGAR